MDSGNTYSLFIRISFFLVVFIGNFTILTKFGRIIIPSSIIPCLKKPLEPDRTLLEHAFLPGGVNGVVGDFCKWVLPWVFYGPKKGSKGS